MKNKKYDTVETVLNSNRKIVGRGKIVTTKTQIQMYTSAHFPGLVQALQ